MPVEKPIFSAGPISAPVGHSGPDKSHQLSRRMLLGSLAATAAGFGLPAIASPPSKIVSLDYGLASTLLSLGVVPAAVASLADWNKWVVQPAMPKGVIDLGGSWEANFEVLAMLKPDLILTTPYLDALQTKLQSLAPVLRLSVYTPDAGPILPATIAATRQLGAAIGRPAEANRFLDESDTFFDLCRQRLAGRAWPSLALVNFMDPRHVRIYGRPGLFHNVLDRIGLRNAWTEPSNYWGFQTIAVEQLSRIPDRGARLVALEPLPADVLPTLRESPLWQQLPFAQPGHFSILPAALMFGMVNEARRFAGLITDMLVSGA